MAATSVSERIGSMDVEDDLEDIFSGLYSDDEVVLPETDKANDTQTKAADLPLPPAPAPFSPPAIHAKNKNLEVSEKSISCAKKPIPAANPSSLKPATRNNAQHLSGKEQAEEASYSNSTDLETSNQKKLTMFPSSKSSVRWAEAVYPSVSQSQYIVSGTREEIYDDPWLEKLCFKPPAIPSPDPTRLITGGAHGLDGDCKLSQEPTQNVYIRGLAANTSDRLLSVYGKRFGSVMGAKAMLEKGTRICKGYGWLNFETIEHARVCLRAMKQLGYTCQYAVNFSNILQPFSEVLYSKKKTLSLPRGSYIGGIDTASPRSKKRRRSKKHSASKLPLLSLAPKKALPAPETQRNMESERKLDFDNVPLSSADGNEAPSSDRASRYLQSARLLSHSICHSGESQGYTIEQKR